MKTDPACGSVVAAVEDDPFYRSISEEFAGDVAERRSVLTRYFAYSIEEGRELGRTVHLDDATRGIAVWLETFGLRTVRFYERLGFSTVARFDEPTTGAPYALMVRNPQTPQA